MARHAIDAACTEHKNTEDTDFYTVLSKKMILSQCIDNYYWHYSFNSYSQNSCDICDTQKRKQKQMYATCFYAPYEQTAARCVKCVV